MTDVYEQQLLENDHEAEGRAGITIAIPEPSDNGQDEHDEESGYLQAMPPAIREEARVMLEQPQLLAAISDDIASIGIAGEMELSLAIYVVGTSRLLGKPLACIVQGPSSSGKSYTLERVADLFPPETKIEATQMSPQALFHMKPGSLQNRFVIAGERSRREDDDTAEASRALREMLSSGRLCKLIASPVGKGIETVLIEQQGPISYAETTTLHNIFAEDLNRMLLLTTDERPKQTSRIIKSLAQSWTGANPSAAERIILRHHAIQRMLRPWAVTIPYAAELANRFPVDRVESRRAFPQVLGCIAAITLLHQRQRQVDSDGRLVADPADYRYAAQLIGRAISRSVAKGVSDASMRFLGRLAHRMGQEEFTVAEAAKGDEGSKSSIYGWVSELVDAGSIEVVSEKAGPKAARYRVTGEPPGDTDVLPPPEAIPSPAP